MTDGVRGEAVTPLMCLEGNHTVTEENRLSERQVLIQLAGRAELHLLGEGVKESDFFFFLALQSTHIQFSHYLTQNQCEIHPFRQKFGVLF